MNCSEFKDLLNEYLTDPSMDEELKRSIEIHALECSECAFLYRINHKLEEPNFKQKLKSGRLNHLVKKSKEYIENNHYDDAIECLEEALLLRPDDSEIIKFIESIKQKQLNLRLFINGKQSEDYKTENGKLIVQLYTDFQIEPVTIYIEINDKEHFYKEFGKEELGVVRDAAKTENIVKVDFGIKRTKEKYKGIIDYELLVDLDKGSAELIVEIEF